VVFHNALHDSELKTSFLCVFCEKDDDGGDFLGVLHTKWEQQVLVTTH
jgi:hypothetical protein